MWLLAKKTDDLEWEAAARGALVEAASLAETLKPAAEAVAADSLTGWTLHERLIFDLPRLQLTLDQVRNRLRSVGSPRSDPELKKAKRAADRCCIHLAEALRWGKVYFADAAGEPGRQALWGGISGQAAGRTLAKNGTRFADHTFQAASAAELAEGLLPPLRSKITGLRPQLVDALLEEIDAGEPIRRRLRTPYYDFTTVAMVSGYLFREAATLGLAVREDPLEVSALIYDKPSDGNLRALALMTWEFVDAHVFEDAASLGLYFLQNQFPNVYRRDGLLGDRRRAEKQLGERWEVTRTRVLWSTATALGLGFGLFEADRAARVLRREFGTVSPGTPDQGSEATAERSFLAADGDVEQRLESVRSVARGLAASFYPGLVDALQERERPTLASLPQITVPEAPTPGSRQPPVSAQPDDTAAPARATERTLGPDAAREVRINPEQAAEQAFHRHAADRDASVRPDQRHPTWVRCGCSPAEVAGASPWRRRKVWLGISAATLVGFAILSPLVNSDDPTPPARSSGDSSARFVGPPSTATTLPQFTPVPTETPTPVATAEPVDIPFGRFIANTGGEGVQIRTRCAEDAGQPGTAIVEGAQVRVTALGRGECEGWRFVEHAGSESWVRGEYLAAIPVPTRTPTRAPTTAPAPRATAAPVANCHSSYPTVCIPPPPPDLDCPQIPYRRFTVVGSDPHRFDGDNDGIGCER